MATKQKMPVPARPMVVATVHTAAGWRQARRGGVRGADWLELRLDLLPEADAAGAARLDRPVLITARHPAEGGAGALPGPRRAAMLREFLPAAAAVDVELRSAAPMADLLAEAAGMRVLRVVSFHDFRRTPSLAVLRGKVRRAVRAGADIVKVATMLCAPADLAVLLRLLALRAAAPLAVMGMGPLGRAARPVLAVAGSVLNYGYLDRPQVDGQMAAVRLRELIDELSP